MVVGYRRGLCGALDRLGVEFVIWDARRGSKAGAVDRLVAPVGSGPRRLRATLEWLASRGPFRHVIAGTESAVVPAAMLRRELGARRMPLARVRRCHDKLLMKRFLADRGIPMTAFRSGGGQVQAERLLAELGSPVVVKARKRSGGREVLFARDLETLRLAPRAGRYYERYVAAEEASVRAGTDGFVVRLLVEPGSPVKPDDPLVVCEEPSVESTVRVLEAEIAELEARRVQCRGVGWGGPADPDTGGSGGARRARPDGARCAQCGACA